MNDSRERVAIPLPLLAGLWFAAAAGVPARALALAAARAQAPQPKPADDPGSTPHVDPSRGLRLRAPAAFDGYTLFSPLLSRTTYLVDMDDQVVHEWKTEFAPGNSAFLLGDGHASRSASRCSRR